MHSCAPHDTINQMYAEPEMSDWGYLSQKVVLGEMVRCAGISQVSLMKVLHHGVYESIHSISL